MRIGNHAWRLDPAAPKLVGLPDYFHRPQREEDGFLSITLCFIYTIDRHRRPFSADVSLHAGGVTPNVTASFCVAATEAERSEETTCCRSSDDSSPVRSIDPSTCIAWVTPALRTKIVNTSKALRHRAVHFEK